MLAVTVLLFVAHFCAAQLWPSRDRLYDGDLGLGYPRNDPYLQMPYPPYRDPRALGSGFYGEPGPGALLPPSRYPVARAAPPFDPGVLRGAPPLPNEAAGFRGPYSNAMAMASLMNYVYDRDNFQAQGCAWEPSKNRCADIINQCKGICKDFANDPSVFHDCRCVPYGYAVLLGWI